MRVLLAGGLTPENVADRDRGSAAVGRRRLDGRRGAARSQGSAEAEGVHGSGTRAPRQPLTAVPTSFPTTGRKTSEGDRDLADGRARRHRPLRGVRWPVRSRDVGAGVSGARSSLSGGVGRPVFPRRARRLAPRLRRATVTAHRVQEPRRPPRPPGAAEARGPEPHRVAQDQQRPRPGAPRASDGKGEARRRDGSGATRRGDGDRGRAARHGVSRLHGRGRRGPPSAQRLPHAAARRRGDAGRRPAVAR